MEKRTYISKKGSNLGTTIKKKQIPIDTYTTTNKARTSTIEKRCLEIPPLHQTQNSIIVAVAVAVAVAVGA